jgi:hypothetical protein
MRYLTVGQGLDCLTFAVVATLYGVGGESNPVAHVMFAIGGVTGIIALKVIGMGAMLFLVRYLAGRGRTRMAKIGAGLAGTTGLLGAATNVLSLALLTGVV